MVSAMFNNSVSLIAHFRPAEGAELRLAYALLVIWLKSITF